MRNTLIMKYPAAWHGDMWREAVPVGNGEIGGLVYGGVHKEIIAIIHGKLWEGAKTPELPDVSDTLAKMREFLSQDKPLEAEYIMSEALINAGYNPSIGHPLPLCDIALTMANSFGFTHYRRKLNMETAEASVEWMDGKTAYNRSFFISRDNDISCLKITAKNGTINGDITLKIHDEESLTDAVELKNIETIVKGNTIFFAAENGGSDFGAVMKLHHNGEISSENGTITVKNATEVTAFLSCFIYGKRKEDWKKLDDSLICDSYENELEKHIKIHKPLYLSQHLDLGGTNYDVSNEELLLDSYECEASIELIEKMWSYGRYLLICSSRENGFPCHLYGVWTGCYRAMWAFNMYNVNLQMIYWQVLSGGMPELMSAVFDYVESHMDDYRENAKKLYGCRGINIPSVSTPESGLHKMKSLPHILHWTGAAAWIAQFYYDYYLYTGDVEFLKNRAMPFMQETAEFYEDFLYLGEDGKAVFSPSNSPENAPKNIKDGLDCHEVAVNATMDIALTKEVVGNLLKGAEICGGYEEKIPVWKKLLSSLPEYQVNEDGAIKEWTHPFYEDNYEHRHQSHIYPVFPGYEITRTDNSDLYKAFERAMDLRESVGLKDQSGWSLMYMANVYGRMGKGEKSLLCIDYLARSVLLPNFFTVHNDWRRMGVAMCNDIRTAPIQVDANMGLTSAISEMLVFSTEKEIFLFNAWPKRFKKGSAGPICTRNTSKIDFEWNEISASFKISHTGADKEVTLILPEGMVFKANGMHTQTVVLCEGTDLCGEISYCD